MTYSRLFSLVIYLCCWLYAPMMLYLHQGEVNEVVTIFAGLFHGITNPLILKVLFGIGFGVHSISLFMKDKLTPILAFLIWLIACSIHVENTNGFDHTILLPTQFFFIFVLQRVFQKNFYALQLFFLTLHYTGSGLAKVWESGFSWIDGTSLQLAVFAWCDPNDFFSSLLINHHWLAKGAQGTIFLLELLFPLILIKNRFIKLFFAMIFIVFHLINEMVFHYNFWANIPLLALVLIAFPLFDMKATQADIS